MAEKGEKEKAAGGEKGAEGQQASGDAKPADGGGEKK